MGTKKREVQKATGRSIIITIVVSVQMMVMREFELTHRRQCSERHKLRVLEPDRLRPRTAFKRYLLTLDWRALPSKSRVIKLVTFVIAVGLFAKPIFNFTKRRFQSQPHRIRLKYSSLENSRYSRILQRFPKYGTAEFAEQCNWSLFPSRDETNCTVLARPQPDEFQGLAKWISQIVSGHILARQAACKLLFDYGQDVNIHEIITPFPSFNLSTGIQPMNWSTPSGFECFHENRCVSAPEYFVNTKHALTTIGTRLGGKTIASIPWYRFAAKNDSHSKLYRNKYQDLEQALPGFQLETGMACSLGSLLNLSPSASQFEPRLFKELLPTLQDRGALVMALYIRTGHTDKAADAEKIGKVAEEKFASQRLVATPSLNCALSLEDKYLSEGEESTWLNFSRIVWMLVTDSTYLKDWIATSYGRQNANERLPADRRRWESRVIHREILVTATRGVHTRSQRNPSTTDFAEALIDWYLIGETDFVITSFPWNSFGTTAAHRTARPLYDARTCSRITIVHGNAAS